MASLARRITILIATTSIVVATIATSIRDSRAEDFRIETKIYQGDEKKPVGEATTLFLNGIAYDFLEAPPQTAVYRKAQAGKPGRFILLDPGNRIRTELSTEKIAQTIDKLRIWAGRNGDPFLKFAADPEFDETFEADKGELVLASYVETYKVTTSPSEHPDAMAEYREFLDWYARLNTLLTSGPPPEPRLRLNAALTRFQVVPLKVELTREGKKKEAVRAEHDFTWRLSHDDVERIDKVQLAMTSYREVKNEEFLKLTRPQEKSSK